MQEQFSAMALCDIHSIHGDNLEPQTSNLKPQTSNLKPQTSNLEPRTSNLKPRTSNLEPRTSRLDSLQPSTNLQHLPIMMDTKFL